MDLAQKSKQGSLSSQAQLALAIAIVNSKPARTSVVDHIQQIRLHIKQPRNHSPNPTSASDKYFDSVAFWKQAYTKAEDAQSKLNDRVYELEQRIETLKLKLKQDDGVYNAPESGKRKESKEPSITESQRKRQKANHTISSTLADSGIELVGLSDLITQQGASEAIVLAVIEAAHALLCRSLNKVMNSAEGKKYEGQIVYHMVCFFETVLCELGEICTIQAAGKDSAKDKQNQKSPSSRSLRHLSAPDPSKSSNGEDEVMNMLRRMLAGMMLKATNLVAAGCDSLFEGYLYVFLNRVGTVLSVIGFKDFLTTPDLQVSPDKLPLPGGLRAGIDDNVETITFATVACELETHHLVWLLEKAIALVHSISIKSSLFEDTTAATASKSSNAGLLLRFTKKKLQSTLLKAQNHSTFQQKTQRPSSPKNQNRPRNGFQEKSGDC
ncbi:hypothetical protein UA08_03518 [Talaromyces atroroseus]|uniref:Uncharacterized protein n=1 Tax=Talaromyces atroroseus TaxID=1441469 RepID=A0A225AKW6_TALAT|nr:hypothetical protein UA08_03518 [Talaromyces atroroseus]OKL61530.1 hypothetical protein UA08_03518 [Talaromyces atroroseus]